MTVTVLQSVGLGVSELLIGLLSIVLALVVAFLIYRDANNRGSHHTLAWGIGSFFGGPIVWILYYFVRDEVGSRGSN